MSLVVPEVSEGTVEVPWDVFCCDLLWYKWNWIKQHRQIEAYCYRLYHFLFCFLAFSSICLYIYWTVRKALKGSGQLAADTLDTEKGDMFNPVYIHVLPSLEPGPPHLSVSLVHDNFTPCAVSDCETGQEGSRWEPDQLINRQVKTSCLRPPHLSSPHYIWHRKHKQGACASVTFRISMLAYNVWVYVTSGTSVTELSHPSHPAGLNPLHRVYTHYCAAMLS